MKYLSILLLCTGIITNVYAINNITTTETIVIMRHGEKSISTPKNGQLNCQGFNRSLALTDTLYNLFDKKKPDYIFAPSPEANFKKDNFYYIRPIITIEPTAIKYDLQINLTYSTNTSEQLGQYLNDNKFADKLIYVSWEHHCIPKVAAGIFLNTGFYYQGPSDWMNENDFDTLYVVKIKRTNNTISNVSFEQKLENLNNLSTKCKFSKIKLKN